MTPAVEEAASAAEEDSVCGFPVVVVAVVVAAAAAPPWESHDEGDEPELGSSSSRIKPAIKCGSY